MTRKPRHHEAEQGRDLRTTRVRLPEGPQTAIFQGWGVKF
jgi:hypothetical protein